MSNWTEPGKHLSHEVLVLIKTDHTGMCVYKNKYLYVLKSFIKISPILGHSKNSLRVLDINSIQFSFSPCLLGVQYYADKHG